MQGTFSVVGVGPGDPQLMTLKASKVLEECDVWFVPSAFENGGSMALKIVKGAVSHEGKTIITHRFPMKHVFRGSSPDPEVKRAWKKAAETIIDCLSKGNDVAYPTLGDPAIYSTGFYVLETLQEYGSPFKMEIVPGVSALGASAAVSAVPLCLGDECMAVIPATFENDQILELFDKCDVIVLMKVHKVMERLVRLLGGVNLIDNATLVERSSLREQRIWTDIREAVGSELHYFSTMIVRKNKGSEGTRN